MNKRKKKFKVIELFAGVGSQAMALRNIGCEYEVIGISEIDKFAIKSYEAIHGEVLNFGDITKIEELPLCDLLTYSFPCQSISIAGKQEGIKKGTESGLLLEVKRLLEISHRKRTLPRWLVLENVKNLVSKRFMPQFEEWLDFLSSLGYETKWSVLNAKDYGIPQNRERVFAVSCLGKNSFEFPEKKELALRLKDMLLEDVPRKYFLTERAFKTNICMKDRNGYVRGKVFRPILKEKANISSTILSSSGTRVTDVHIMQLFNIGNPNRLEGNPQSGRVYSEEGISPALSTMRGGNHQPKVVCK